MNQVAIERRVQQSFKVPNPGEDPEYQEDFTHNLIIQENRSLANNTVNTGEESISNTANPSTPPNPKSEEGLPVNPDLLSPRLNRLYIE